MQLPEDDSGSSWRNKGSSMKTVDSVQCQLFVDHNCKAASSAFSQKLDAYDKPYVAFRCQKEDPKALDSLCGNGDGYHGK